nr:hypothetical protein Hi04_10k_c2441B_00010 [uncultured bacterium]
MSSRLFIGNLAPDATEPGIRAFLVARGLAVTHVSIAVARATGLSRGFGFAEFAGAAEADAAVDSLEGASIDGRALIVRHVEERARRF